MGGARARRVATWLEAWPNSSRPATAISIICVGALQSAQAVTNPLQMVQCWDVALDLTGLPCSSMVMVSRLFPVQMTIVWEETSPSPTSPAET